jgi:site-specific DNA-methyltransferase (adenine-specific)
MELDVVYLGDCFDVFEFIPDKSVDMVLCDLPYGVTACHWDVELDLQKLWQEYQRMLKPGGVVVLTATQPFETTLINSNRKWFRYKWVWKKSRAVGFLNANKMPMRILEDILVFAKGRTRYTPQFQPGAPYISKRKASGKSGSYREVKRCETVNPGVRYPKDLVEFSNTCEKVIHNTQKPVALFEYLIKTYTDKGDVVLDNTSGSGTTAIAAMNTGRRYICVEKDMANYLVMVDRVRQHNADMVI